MSAKYSYSKRGKGQTNQENKPQQNLKTRRDSSQHSNHSPIVSKVINLQQLASSKSSILPTSKQRASQEGKAVLSTRTSQNSLCNYYPRASMDGSSKLSPKILKPQPESQPEPAQMMVLELNNPFKSDKKRRNEFKQCKSQMDLNFRANDSYLDYNGRAAEVKQSLKKGKSRSGSKGTDSGRTNVYSYRKSGESKQAYMNDTGQKSQGKNRILSTDGSDKFECEEVLPQQFLNSLSLDEIISLAIQKQSQEDPNANFSPWNQQSSSNQAALMGFLGQKGLGQMGFGQQCSQFGIPGYYSSQNQEMLASQLNDRRKEQENKNLEDRIYQIVEKCLKQNSAGAQMQQVNQQLDFQQRIALSSLGLNSERSPNKDNLKEFTQQLSKKVGDLSKTVEDMHMSLNEKEAEIIRLSLCLGDEKKKCSELSQAIGGRNENTPKRNLPPKNSSNYGSEVLPKATDSPYFFHAHSKKPSCLSTPVEVVSKHVEVQTEEGSALQGKLKKYEEMLRSECEANEELTDRLQDLEQQLFQLKQDKERLQKEVKEQTKEKETAEFEKLEWKSQIEQKDDHINTLKGQLERMSKENVRLQRLTQDCPTCVDYIKKIKSLEFHLGDLAKAQETSVVQLTELKWQADQKEEEVKALKEKVVELEEEQKDWCLPDDGGKELERERKQNQLNEMIIEQLKKQLEKCAYQLISLQEKEAAFPPEEMEMTMSGSQEDKADWT